MTLIAIIPARAGSKGLPKKNTKILASKPLVAHTIAAALSSGVFDRVLVTSDDKDVLRIAEEEGALALHRPGELAGDNVPMAPVVEHALGLYDACDGDGFALLQPTSPLRTAAHIEQCAKLFLSGKYGSVVSVCAIDHPPQKALMIEDGRLVPLVSWDALNQNRQSLQPCYRQNGAMWFVDCEKFLSEGRFVIAPAAPFIMAEDDSIDIDTLDDFIKAERRIVKLRADRS